jgi:exportin-1
MSAFPHLGQLQVQAFVQGLFTDVGDVQVFKNLVRDFLIGLKEFQGDELFIEEREAVTFP